MATRTAGEIYADLVRAGYTPAAAVVQTAIALAESGGDDTQRGDVDLETNYWGPSYGEFQIRTVKGQTGTGGDRDIGWLAQSDANQARAAYDISGHGTDFSPWSTYNTGKYQQFLGQATQAANGTPVTPAGDAGAVSNGILGGVRNIALEGLAVLLGVGLVGFGLVRAVHPGRRAAGELRREADNAPAALGAAL